MGTHDLYRWDLPKRREPEVIAAWSAGRLETRQRLRLVHDALDRWQVIHERRTGSNGQYPFITRSEADTKVSQIMAASGLEWSPVSTSIHARI